ncbi:uncharacterized protein LOC141536388 [Cotesia typhae]|uniref:uncharacterized protein LOC141536388 n=1 Tax=Cotesia typhae TaxID=2053667 RepID=UPI003D6813C5
MTCIWVPKGRLNLILFETFLWFLIFLSLGLFFPLIVTVMKFIDNTFVVMKSFILIVGTVNYIIKVIVCRIYRDELQELGRSLNDFIRNSSPNDKFYLEKYVNKCWIFHGYMTCSYYLTTTVVLMGPLVLPEKFPSDAVYPFSVDHPVVATIVYAHQCIVGYQCSAGMTLDCQAALFLWYLCARFEILISEIENVSSLKDMGVIVRTHQEILRFADRVIRPIRLIVLTTVTMTKIGMISGGLVLISDEPITIKSSKTISEKIFSTAINIPGFLETFSNEYYANFLSTAFSLFTAMHTIVS